MTAATTALSSDRPRMLLLSHVLPYPGSAGQEQRVRETLVAAKPTFHVTFVTSAPVEQHKAITEKLSPLCDEVLILPSLYHASLSHKIAHRAAGAAYAAWSGLKTSNYVIGRLEFSPNRIAKVLQGRQFDIALFEYWHAVDAVPVMQQHGVRCVLDMHDVLWQGRLQRTTERKTIPAPVRDWAVGRYRKREERAWQTFDGIVAINGDERDYVQQQVRKDVPVFYAPMGADLSRWTYQWAPATPPRVAYYGGLGTAHNRRSALQCYHEIMPLVWEQQPTAQLWLVGSNPSKELTNLAKDLRVVVTGFVPHVQETLASMTVVLCPWKGTYGFRSRLVEVMAVGVPVVASPDAVAGMGLTAGHGLFLAQNPAEFASHAVHLLRDHPYATQQSQLARQQTEELFSLDATYLRLMRDLKSWLGQQHV